MSEAEHYLMRQRLNAGRLSKVQRGEYVQRLPTGLVRLADTPRHQRSRPADPTGDCSSSSASLRNSGPAIGSCATASSMPSCCRGATGAPQSPAPCVGASPQTVSLAASSPIRRMPAPSSTAGAPVIPSVRRRGAARPPWCDARWRSGNASSRMPIPPISVGHNSWPIRSAYARTPSAITTRRIRDAARPARGPPYSRDSLTCGRGAATG